MNRFFRSPLGLLLTGTAALLIVSPKARETARKLAARGISHTIDAIDQFRESVSINGIESHRDHGGEASIGTCKKEEPAAGAAEPNQKAAAQAKSSQQGKNKNHPSIQTSEDIPENPQMHPISGQQTGS